MLRLILADAEMETIPENMRNDYTIKKMASKLHKDPALMILDSNYMHSNPRQPRFFSSLQELRRI